MPEKLNYATAGVDLEAASDAVNRYKRCVERTHVPGVLGDLGGFGGLFSLRDACPEVEDPILVSGTDGVGTKLKIAFATGDHQSIGQDLVAMCVNDIVTTGAKVLFFLDYLATGKLLPEQAEQIVMGIAHGCQLANCALVGGETAEMPGFYPPGEYDVAGFAVGVVDRSALIRKETVSNGDLIVGIHSSGFHSNGFSLVRTIVERAGLSYADTPDALDAPLGASLLTPTLIYVPFVLDLISRIRVHSLAHITGGGLYENLPRALPNDLGAVLDPSAWPVPQVVSYLCDLGEIAPRERYRVFNMGIGLTVTVAPGDVDHVLSCANEHDLGASIIGEVTPGPVTIAGCD